MLVAKYAPKWIGGNEVKRIQKLTGLISVDILLDVCVIIFLVLATRYFSLRTSPTVGLLIRKVLRREQTLVDEQREKMLKDATTILLMQDAIDKLKELLTKKSNEVL